MTERPIPFKPEMVAAILAGRKTVTRRVIPHFNGSAYGTAPERVGWWKFDEGRWWAYEASRGSSAFPIYGFRHRYGVPGDRLWLKERYCFLDVEKSSRSRYDPPDSKWWSLSVEYSDGTQNSRYIEGKKPRQTRERGEVKWAPAMFMPRWASRLDLEVVDVRIERLHEISNEDIALEGAILRDQDTQFGMMKISAFDGMAYLDPRHLWAAGWDKINARRGFAWAMNPWVTVTTFKKGRSR